jgi:hypothetical protein
MKKKTALLDTPKSAKLLKIVGMPLQTKITCFGARNVDYIYVKWPSYESLKMPHTNQLWSKFNEKTVMN